MAIVVNGQRIEDAVLDSEFSGIKAYFESLGNVSCCERDGEFRGYARQHIIARALLAQEAQRAVEPTPAAEVDAALEKFKEEHGGEASFYAAVGASPDQIDLIRRDIELDLRVRRLVEELSAADGAPGEQDLRAYYDQHVDAFMTAEEVRASHVLKAPQRGEDRGGSYEELRQLRRHLRHEGADFDELARKHSDRGEDNVDLGFFKRGELADEFEAVAFSLEVGEISPVFASPFGYHLIKLTDRRPATPKPFDEVRGEVEQRYQEDRRQERTRELVEQLQSRATIEDVQPEPVG